MTDRPEYDSYTDMSKSRAAVAEAMAHQILETVEPWVDAPIEALRVLDAGSGYGGTALALGRRCAHVTGYEPATSLYEASLVEASASGLGNVAFVNAPLEELAAEGAFDLVVLDNVYEHLPDQPAALTNVVRALRAGGVLYLLVPNKIWPIEAHYRLPFLSWLPLRWANRYLRVSGRGTDYEDASYAPTLGQLRRALRAQPLDFQLVLPGAPEATKLGLPLHYRLGIGLIKRFPALWWVSKALLVVAVKRAG